MPPTDNWSSTLPNTPITAKQLVLTECAANNCSPAEPVCQQLAESSRTRGRGTPAANGWRGPRAAGQIWWKRNSCHQRLVMAANGWSNMVEEELPRSPRTAKACLPSMPPPDCTLPRVLPRRARCAQQRRHQHSAQHGCNHQLVTTFEPK